MKIMDQGSGRGLAKAMNVKMSTTAHLQPLSMVRPFMRPSMLRPTRNSGSRKATPKTRMRRMTKDRYRLAWMNPVPEVGMKLVRMVIACGRIHTPRAAPEPNRSRPTTP